MGLTPAPKATKVSLNTSNPWAPERGSEGCLAKLQHPMSIVEAKVS